MVDSGQTYCGIFLFVYIDCQLTLQRIRTISSLICKVHLTLEQINFVMDNTHVCVNMTFTHIVTQNALC